MNKLLIIESGDRLGKGSLIKGLCEYFDYKNIIIRHCDKPPKNISQNEVLDFQFKCFEQEFQMINYIQTMNCKLMYHDNIIIYDRFYLGEYVYGQMFRAANPDLLKMKLQEFEVYNLNRDNVYLITLTSDPEFFLSKEDGQSFSQNLEQKTKELELFKEAHEFSLIKNKLLLKVDKTTTTLDFIDFAIPGKTNIFRPKQDILNEVIDFINEK